MKAKFSFDDLIKVTGGKALEWPEDNSVMFSLSTDTRSISPGDVYLPLKGANFDGHAFIKDAISKGISGFFLEKGFAEKVCQSPGIFVIEVENTLTALLSLASYHRKRMPAKIIAITGSSGKTTSKELISSMLSEQFNVLKSYLNYNNEIGVSKTLLDLNDSHDIAVIEMGMRGPGEIDLLARYALPDIAVIMNVGTSHIGLLGNRENIAKAKTEILNYLQETDGVGILYGEDGLLMKTVSEFYKAKKICFGFKKDFEVKAYGENDVTFTYKDNEYTLNIPGDHNVINATAAIEIGKLFGMNHQAIAAGLKTYRPVFGRWEVFELGNGSRLINDAYNANPDSMRAAINTVINSFKGKEVWLILGDMLELGTEEVKIHCELGSWLKEKEINTLITVGKLASCIADPLKDTSTDIFNVSSPVEAAEKILDRKPQNAIILLKASRSIGLEKILEVINITEKGESH